LFQQKNAPLLAYTGPLINSPQRFNPYHADTFAVIRHPVDRAVSEYQATLVNEGGFTAVHDSAKNMTKVSDVMNPKKRKAI
jgi:hypothetical protein